MIDIKIVSSVLPQSGTQNFFIVYIKIKSFINNQKTKMCF